MADDVGAPTPPPSLQDSSSPSRPLDAGSLRDGATNSDGGAVDASPAMDGGCLLAGFTPIYHPPPAGTRGACSATEIAYFESACLDGADAGDCSWVGQGNPTCAACLYTVNPAASSSWGVVLRNDQGRMFELNPGGCYATESTAAEARCGQALQSQLECEHFVCDPTSFDFATYQTCETKADTEACSCYVSVAQSACAAYSSSNCNPSQNATFLDAYNTLARTMCGP